MMCNYGQYWTLSTGVERQFNYVASNFTRVY